MACNCIVPDNGSGTVDLPPTGCEYASIDEKWMIIDGLPPGTTIEGDGILSDWSSVMRWPGGGLGGEIQDFDALLDLTLVGSGDLTGFNRHVVVPVNIQTHSAPRTPGDPVQQFNTDMYGMSGELFGDPDFCVLRVNAGTSQGLPSPGQTTLTDLGGGLYSVDSFFDVTYQIEFEGCPGSPLEGYAGTTTATIRILTEACATTTTTTTAPPTTTPQPATIGLRPVSATGPYSIVGNQITVTPGSQITLEIQITGWVPSLLRTYQASLDSSGYTSGAAGSLSPLVIPDPAAGCFIDAGHPNYVFAGEMGLPATDTSTPDYRWGNTLLFGGVPDPGAPKYGATLVVDASPTAAGTFTLGFLPGTGSFGTFLQDDASANIPVVLVPAQIAVVPQEAHDADTGPGSPDFRIQSTEVLSYASAYLAGNDTAFPGISPPNRTAWVLRAAAIFLANFQGRYMDEGTAAPRDSTAHPQRWQEQADL